MKRTLLVVIALSLLLAACASTAPTPSVRGTITARNENVLTIADEKAQSTDVSVTRATQVRWENGLEAKRADLVAGQRVQVWYSGAEAATPVAAKIIIEP